MLDVVDALGASAQRTRSLRRDTRRRTAHRQRVPHRRRLGVIAAVVGESLIGRQGLGVEFAYAYRLLDLPRAFGAAIVIVVLSVAVFSLAGRANVLSTLAGPDTHPHHPPRTTYGEEPPPCTHGEASSRRRAFSGTDIPVVVGAPRRLRLRQRRGGHHRRRHRRRDDRQPPRRARPAGARPPRSDRCATVFNWLPDIEWSAWYLAERTGYFTDEGVESALVHGGPNPPAVPQVMPRRWRTSGCRPANSRSSRPTTRARTT